MTINPKNNLLNRSIWFPAAVLLVLALMAASNVSAADVPRMDVKTLADKLDSGDVIVLDVRRDSNWDASEYKIKNALRADPKKFSGWSQTLPKDKALVLYCA